MSIEDWTVDLEKSTATHKDGWVFEFEPAPDTAGAHDGWLVSKPESLTTEQLMNASRIASEAGDAYSEALSKRH